MSINVRSGRYRPEGAKGLSLGFEPQEHVHTTTRPVRAEDVCDGRLVVHLLHFRKTDLPPLSSFVILHYGGQVGAETKWFPKVLLMLAVWRVRRITA